ncbi:hypothetical protein V8C44DRAFT_163090 [Trichoderma aethiopicum]
MVPASARAIVSAEVSDPTQIPLSGCRSHGLICRKHCRALYTLTECEDGECRFAVVAQYVCQFDMVMLIASMPSRGCGQQVGIYGGIKLDRYHSRSSLNLFPLLSRATSRYLSSAQSTALCLLSSPDLHHLVSPSPLLPNPTLILRCVSRSPLLSGIGDSLPLRLAIAPTSNAATSAGVGKLKSGLVARAHRQWQHCQHPILFDGQ